MTCAQIHGPKWQTWVGDVFSLVWPSLKTNSTSWVGETDSKHWTRWSALIQRKSLGISCPPCPPIGTDWGWGSWRDRCMQSEDTTAGLTWTQWSDGTPRPGSGALWPQCPPLGALSESLCWWESMSTNHFRFSWTWLQHHSKYAYTCNKFMITV